MEFNLPVWSGCLLFEAYHAFIYMKATFKNVSFVAFYICQCKHAEFQTVSISLNLILYIFDFKFVSISIFFVCLLQIKKREERSHRENIFVQHTSLVFENYIFSILNILNNYMTFMIDTHCVLLIHVWRWKKQYTTEKKEMSGSQRRVDQRMINHLL